MNVDQVPTGDVRAVPVGGHDLGGRVGPGGELVARRRPQAGLVVVEELGDGPPVPRVRNAAVQPSLHRARVHADAPGNGVHVHPGRPHGGS